MISWSKVFLLYFVFCRTSVENLNKWFIVFSFIIVRILQVHCLNNCGIIFPRFPPQIGFGLGGVENPFTMLLNVTVHLVCLKRNCFWLQLIAI